MLEIKTVANRNATDFDEGVNAALREGWELVRRECIIIDHTPILYAELERIVDEPEEEEELEEDDGTAEWKLSRDPLYPFRCTACGCKSQDALRNCPHCKRIMVMPE